MTKQLLTLRTVLPIRNYIPFFVNFNIKMDLQELGCGGMDWFELAQGRDRWRTLVSTVMNPRVP
jgi:hypothetical protein